MFGHNSTGFGWSKIGGGPIPPTPAETIVNDFRDRVLADSGTFEAYNCMVANIQALLDIDLLPVGDAVMTALQTRAITDSGTFEAFVCGSVYIQDLADINI